jgi:hypothetical protein
MRLFASDSRVHCRPCAKLYQREQIERVRPLSDRKFAADPDLRARVTAQLIEAGRRNAISRRLPKHPCEICGKEVAGTRLVCSNECHQEARRRARPTPPPCSVEGCQRQHVAKGLCSLHYQREKKS